MYHMVDTFIEWIIHQMNKLACTFLTNTICSPLQVILIEKLKDLIDLTSQKDYLSYVRAGLISNHQKGLVVAFD